MATLTTPCAFVVDSGIVTISMAAGEYALVARTDGGTLLVNGTPCGVATATNVNRININGSADAGASETVILDYLNGTFALGTTSTPGVNVDLKAGTDALKVRGSTDSDTYYVASVTPDAGASGVYAIGLNTLARKNILFNNVESLVISTGPGTDTLYTNGKADAGIGGRAFGLTTTTGGPTLAFYGGEEADTLNMGSAAGGAVTFYGGEGIDAVDLSTRTSDLTITLGASGVCQASETCFFKNDVETITAGSGNDTLACAGSADAGCTLNGGSGNDSLTGGPHNDVLSGGNGNDTLIPAAGDDSLTGGSGTDTVSYADRAAGDAGVTIDLASGVAGVGAEADTIATCENVVGGDDDDTITGDGSDNVITGGLGNDHLLGGAGNDTFDEGDATSGTDDIDGQAGEDTVDYSGRTGNLSVTLDHSTVSGETGEDDVVGAENVLGGGGNDTLTGNAADNVIEGGAGDDTIDAAGGNDTVDPGAGTGDSVTCGDGNDVLLPGQTTTPNALEDCEG